MLLQTEHLRRTKQAASYSHRINTTQGVTLLHTEHLRWTTTDRQLQPQNQYYTGHDATTHGTLKMDNNRRTATATDSYIFSATQSVTLQTDSYRLSATHRARPYRRTATDSMLHTGRDATEGQLQTQCYTQGVTLQTDSYIFNATHRA